VSRVCRLTGGTGVHASSAHWLLMKGSAGDRCSTDMSRLDLHCEREYQTKLQGATHDVLSTC
jgi:hypothetical protein